MNISFYNIDKIYLEHKKNITKIMDKTFSSGKVLMGNEVEKFEEEIAEKCERKYAVTVGSCTDSLYFALKSLGIKQGDEVLVTSLSFVASVTAILRCKAIPVFVDIKDNYMMDINDIEKKITYKTKAIMAVHLFGQMLPIKEILEIANTYHLFVIEDAAQSLGSTYLGKPAGSFGDISCISFDPTKIIGAFGTGGVLLTDKAYIYELVKKLRYKHSYFNSRISSFQAALLSYQLNYLDKWIEDRQYIAGVYKILLKNEKWITLPAVANNCTHIWHKFVISVNPKIRNKLKDYLQKNGIQTMIHYEKPLFESKNIPDNLILFGTKIKYHKNICDSVLSLPIYPELTDKEIVYITKKIKEFNCKEIK